MIESPTHGLSRPRFKSVRQVLSPSGPLQPAVAGASTRDSSLLLLVTLTAVFCVAYLPWLTLEPASAGLETTRILVARSMLRTGEWIVPMQNGQPYLAKPPLGYWLIALGSVPFGAVTVLSARLVAALCTLGVALGTGAFAARELGTRVGMWAGLSVLLAALSLDQGLRAELDAPLALFSALAIFALFRCVFSSDRGVSWTIVSGLALGAATLVKGPVALLVFVIALAGLAIGTRGRRRIVFARGGVALSIGILVAGVWLALLFERVDARAGSSVMWSEVFRRVYDAGATNREPFWFYVPALLVAFAPASLCLPALARWRSMPSLADERRRSLFGMLLGWSVCSLVVLSFSQGKETRYLTATIPAWAVLTAWAWIEADARWLTRYRASLKLAGAVLAGAAPLILLVLGWRLRPAAWPIGVGSAALAAIAAWTLHRSRKTHQPAYAWMALFVGLLSARLFWGGVLMTNRSDTFPIERMGSEIAARLEPGEPIVQLGEYASYLELHLDHQIRVANSIQDLPTQLRAAPPAHYVLARDRLLPRGSEQGLVEVASWPFGNSRFRLLRAPPLGYVSLDRDPATTPRR